MLKVVLGNICKQLDSYHVLHQQFFPSKLLSYVSPFLRGFDKTQSMEANIYPSGFYVEVY